MGKNNSWSKFPLGGDIGVSVVVGVVTKVGIGVTVAVADGTSVLVGVAVEVTGVLLGVPTGV